MLNIPVDILAVDPLALMLRHDIYILHTLVDPPPIDVLVERLAPVLSKLDETERQVIRSRARWLATHAIAVEKALGPE